MLPCWPAAPNLESLRNGEVDHPSTSTRRTPRNRSAATVNSPLSRSPWHMGQPSPYFCSPSATVCSCCGGVQAVGARCHELNARICPSCSTDRRGAQPSSIAGPEPPVRGFTYLRHGSRGGSVPTHLLHCRFCRATSPRSSRSLNSPGSLKRAVIFDQAGATSVSSGAEKADRAGASTACEGRFGAGRHRKSSKLTVLCTLWVAG